MKKRFGILMTIAFCAIFSGVTGSQVNEPVKIGIEKIACHQPDANYVALPQVTKECPTLIVCGKCESTEFRLVAENEKTRITSKPCALVMCTSVTPTGVNCPVGSDRLFLPPQHENQLNQQNYNI